MKDKTSAKHTLDIKGIKRDLVFVAIFAIITFSVITMFKLTGTNAQTFASVVGKLGKLL